ncbi:biotin-dependent carboxyltransferase family protein [Thalassobacillus pellis]|uniref:5-oxoprolinase subunit C family protein n=1 Tax=Thalassobacillus pellis TaxID=748008 RepID=UPI00196035F3|nr:biotin-dependent carboxyltransferase family protein [Thalassobacillus pellis]MBM7551952.1 antagonist of KipI [Thalassobacillus pellis]
MIKVLKPGLLTSIQDLGRRGYQKYGVITSGAMDPLAHRIANLLVGNKDNSAALEITLSGPVLEFQEEGLISLCGGDLSPVIDGESVEMWRPVYVKPGSELRFGQAKQGCRLYLAVAGGFDVPEVMESKSTYLRAGIGGFHGRAVKEADELVFGEASERSQKIMEELRQEAEDSSFASMDWYIASEFLLVSQEVQPVRVMPGRQFDLFNQESKAAFFQEDFQIDSKSDRMGYRLEGPALHVEKSEDMLSEPVSFGTVQVPSNGKPIILLADRQTTGGYPKIAQIATVDLPVIAQMKPGEKMKFVEISHREAEMLLLEREYRIHQLIQGIRLKFQ